MSEFKFACPTCGQHIAGDERWAGMQIKCPACQADMMVPPLETAPAPAPPPPVRLSVAATPAPPIPASSAPPAPSAPSPPAPAMAPARLSIAAAPAPAPARAPAAHSAPVQPAFTPPAPAPGAGSKAYVPSYLKTEEKRGKGRAIITVAVVLAVLVAAAFVVAPMINSAQERLNKSRKKDTEDGGGEVGHMLALNRALDETDPTRFERFAGEKPDKILPTPPYTLDVAAAVIPTGNVRGKISNVRFTLEDARLEVQGATYVLTFREGPNVLADREMVISFKLKPGESIQGKSWTISKDMTAGGPGIAKKWFDLRDQPQKQAAFASGYALKLEFDKAVTGVIPGKIYLALPDAEQSVIAGEFSADIRVPTAAGSKRSQRPMSRFDDE